jgi:TetR/AcrR family transcriptional regulator, transcriptional repressor for nem operon
MNRPRSFDPDELRERLTDVFIEHGYRGTSMNMLTEAAGLGRQSLYNAIGDKEAAYIQSLDCAGRRNTALKAAMEQEPNGRRAIERFFEEVIDASVKSEPAHKNCILTAGLMEGIEAAAVATKLREKWHELCVELQGQVERGQADGSIRDDAPGASMTTMLVTLFLGIRVAARTPTQRATLENTVRWVIQLLDRGSPLP